MGHKNVRFTYLLTYLLTMTEPNRKLANEGSE